MTVDVERRGQVLVIRMLREEKRNAVDRALADALDAGFNQLEDDPELWVGVLTGTPAVFSAGTDLHEPRSPATERVRARVSSSHAPRCTGMSGRGSRRRTSQTLLRALTR